MSVLGLKSENKSIYIDECVEKISYTTKIDIIEEKWIITIDKSRRNWYNLPVKGVKR